MHYLALCCIARDEDPFLKEWLAFHALLGVEHFYIYDNMSRTPIATLLKGFAGPDRITIRRIAGTAIQRAVYQDCLETFGKDCFWIGFIDLDEFFCPLKDNDLRVFLSEFEDYAGLGVPWDMFSSAGHDTRPEGLVLKNYTRRLLATRDTVHIKTILRPARTRAALNPHAFRYEPGALCVTEDHMPIPAESPFAFSRRRRIRLNHYFYRSRQDFAEKIQRGRADTGAADPRSMAMFDAQCAAPQTEETAILRFLPPLEQALAADALPAAPATPPELPPFPIPDSSAFWTARAAAARLAGHYDRAERFLYRALALEEQLSIYMELIALRKAQKRLDDADALQTFLRELLKIKRDASGAKGGGRCPPPLDPPSRQGSALDPAGGAGPAQA